jgi:hypothetical protein
MAQMARTAAPDRPAGQPEEDRVHWAVAILRSLPVGAGKAAEARGDSWDPVHLVPTPAEPATLARPDLRARRAIQPRPDNRTSRPRPAGAGAGRRGQRSGRSAPQAQTMPQRLLKARRCRPNAPRSCSRLGCGPRILTGGHRRSRPSRDSGPTRERSHAIHRSVRGSFATPPRPHLTGCCPVEPPPLTRSRSHGMSRLERRCPRAPSDTRHFAAPAACRTKRLRRRSPKARARQTPGGQAGAEACRRRSAGPPPRRRCS